jgi:hypothetical protein
MQYLSRSVICHKTSPCFTHALFSHIPQNEHIVVISVVYSYVRSPKLLDRFYEMWCREFWKDYNIKKFLILTHLLNSTSTIRFSRTLFMMFIYIFIYIYILYFSTRKIMLPCFVKLVRIKINKQIGQTITDKENVHRHRSSDRYGSRDEQTQLDFLVFEIRPNIANFLMKTTLYHL